MRQARFIKGNPQLNEGNKITVLLDGKKYERVVRWKDLGNNEGYPYIIIDKKRVLIREV